MNKTDDRKYLAISLKHSDKFPDMLWGHRRTKDDEERCYSDYTTNVDNAELYSIEEFKEHYGDWLGIFNYSPLPFDELKANFKQLKKVYDTVFVLEEEYKENLGYSKINRPQVDDYKVIKGSNRITVNDFASYTRDLDKYCDKLEKALDKACQLLDDNDISYANKNGIEIRGVNNKQWKEYLLNE